MDINVFIEAIPDGIGDLSVFKFIVKSIRSNYDEFVGIVDLELLDAWFTYYCVWITSKIR